MAGNAPELAAAPLEAKAADHLLGMSDGFIDRSGRTVVHSDERGQERVQCQAGPELVRIASETGDTDLSREVALLANRFSSRGLEVCRVDNGGSALGIDITERLNVQLPGPMAAPAANRQVKEDRGLVMILSTRHGIDPSGMAIQAIRRDGSLEMWVIGPIARGEVPPLSLGIPGNRRLVEKPLSSLHQEGDAPGPRSQGVAHLQGGPADDRPRGIGPGLGVDDSAVETLDLVFQSVGFKQDPGLSVSPIPDHRK